MTDGLGARPGDVLGGRYRLLRHLADGGMAEVWEAHDTTLDRPVAVKMLHARLAADPEFVARFRREAVSSARLSHPNIVAVYDAGTGPGTDAGRAYMVMELIRGESLRALTSKGLAVQRVVDIAAQAAEGLAYAHQHGIVHRDVKPANILVQPDWRVKVTDFGIAKAVSDARDDGEDLTRAGAVLGTAKYLSPEQVEGTGADPRSDIYSLGVVLYETLCGRAPFQGPSDLATAVEHVKGTAPRPRQLRPGLPPALEAVILRAMARVPAERYPTAFELARVLRGLQASGVLVDDAIPAVQRRGTDHTPPERLVGAAESASRGTGTAALARTRIGLDDGPPEGRPGVSGATTTVSVGSPGQQRRPRERAQRSLAFAGALAVLGGASLGGAAGILAANRRGGDGILAVIERTTSFDPDGDQVERDSSLPKLTDGDPTTQWSTSDPLLDKSGVGVIVHLADAQPLRSLEVRSPSKGWAAEVFVATTAFNELSRWGSPEDLRGPITGDVTLSLRGQTGSYVLLWITDFGPNKEVRIGELRVRK